MGYRAFPSSQVSNGRVQVDVVEVTRGERGGVIRLTITNEAPEVLVEAVGAAALLTNEAKEPVPSLTMTQLQNGIDRFGPRSFGLASWSRQDPAARLDPLLRQVHLKTGERAALEIGFEAPPVTRRLSVDLSEVFRWRGNAAAERNPLIIEVDLPALTTARPVAQPAPPGVHFGVSISSDDLSR